jgi:hypothetical protein
MQKVSVILKDFHIRNFCHTSTCPSKPDRHIDGAPRPSRREKTIHVPDFDMPVKIGWLEKKVNKLSEVKDDGRFVSLR